jgi:hypothetical protein
MINSQPVAWFFLFHSSRRTTFQTGLTDRFGGQKSRSRESQMLRVAPPSTRIFAPVT